MVAVQLKPETIQKTAQSREGKDVPTVIVPTPIVKTAFGIAMIVKKKDSKEKTMIYKGYSGTPIYRIEGDKIYQGYSGTFVYRIDGNMIYRDYSGTPINRIE